jgi:hypothetical protein
MTKRSLLPLCQAVLLATAALAAPAFAATPEKPAAKHASPAKSEAKPVATQKAVKKTDKKTDKKQVAAAKPQKPGPLADLGDAKASADVVHVANWVSYTHNNQKKAFVIVDKKAAQVYVFDPKGKLVSGASPVLLGMAVGDNVLPVGNKPISKLQESEKTTPAGRFLAQPGKNNHGANIIWIDYKNSLSMHSMHSVSASEQRADRMNSPEADDNRISNGCINVPPRFYSSVVWPAVRKYGAYVYVLPETRTPQQQFGSYDVTQVAKAG